MSQETKLGLFVLVGLAALVVSIILLGDFQFQSRYTINVLFNDIAGLPDKAKVKIAGVEVGAVKGISLDQNRAKVKIWIKKDVKIYADAQANIVSTGIIGSKYLELTVGNPGLPPLKDGDTIIGNEPVSLNKVVENVMSKIDEIVKVFQGPEGAAIGKNLAATITNLRDVTDALRVALADQEGQLVNIVRNLDSFTGDLAEISRENKAELKVALASISRMSARLDRILARIDNGEGTIGKLVSDKEMGEDLKTTVVDLKESTRQAKQVLRRLNLIETHWDYTLRYDTKYEVARHDFGLRVIPRPGKFYYLGGSNLGSTDDESAAADIEEANTINFLLGKQFGPTQLYGGVIRSKGGLGMTVKPFWKWSPLNRLEMTAEAYDFGRKRPTAKAKVNVGARARVTEWGYVGVQAEDVYYATAVNAYVNLNFRDDDIAYILGLVGLAKP
jgi:phospholipid/cholesterol/gamma-HCH transport system substrate-binding protein